MARLKKKKQNKDSEPQNEGNDTKSDRENKKVTGAFIHYSDCLNLDVHLLHPSVKVFIMNLDTKSLVEKQDRNKSVTCYKETNVKHILPLMTQPYVFKIARTLIPRWEELLLFNEEFEYLASFKENLILFFLIQDFVSMSRANNKKSTTNGWRDIAWGFLKPFPSSNVSNIEKKLRLQLFKPNPRKAKDIEDESQCLFNWWTNCKHVKYPSSLYVTLQSIDPPGKDIERGALDEILGMPDQIPLRGLNGSRIGATDDPLAIAMEAPKVPIWARGPGQHCIIPNKKIAEIENMGQGCSVVKFSKEGRYLAIAAPNDHMWSISVCDVTHNWQKVRLFNGHTSTIYDLDWFDHKTLLSCSGDLTARIWNLPSSTSISLEHPAFVYCARFHPNSDGVVVTGSYDKVIRIWKLCHEEEEENGDAIGMTNQFEVSQELVEHDSYITSLEFDSEGQNFYSGDKSGTIRVWEVIGGNNVEKKFHTSIYFRLRKQIKLSQLEGYSIDALRVHPGGRRMLIQSGSLISPLVMIDLTRQNSTVMQEYKMSQGSRRRKIGTFISPCGNLVLSGCQHPSGCVMVWDTDTGIEKHVYEYPIGPQLQDAFVVNAIAFHPFDHLVAFGGLGANKPVAIFKFDKILNNN